MTPAERGATTYPGGGALQKDTDLDAVAAEVRAEVDRLRAIHEASGRIQVVGRSSDGLVTVDMNGHGTIDTVKFHPQALERYDHVSLSAAVSAAIADAGRRALADVLPAYPELADHGAPETWPYGVGDEGRAPRTTDQ